MRSLNHRDLVKLVVSYVSEARLAGQRAVVNELPDVWDLWYLCHRLWRPAEHLGIAGAKSGTGCLACRDLVARLTASCPPGYPARPSVRCDCFLTWAVRMRSRHPASPFVDSLAMALSFALLKPGAPVDAIHRMLGVRYRVAERRVLPLTPVDMARLYPDAYGEEFLAWQARYLGSGPVEALLLTASSGAPVCAAAVRLEVRRSLGVMDESENHLHMPDTPGEALANIEQFFGPEVLRDWYRRIELAHGRRRLALYRALLAA